jgi:hypothetical protein
LLQSHIGFEPIEKVPVIVLRLSLQERSPYSFQRRINATI